MADFDYSEAKREIKCVVWDLDNTIWDGILLEGDDVTLRPGIIELLRTLDERGILASIASRSDKDAVMQKLKEFAIGDYFLYPQIDWDVKAASILKIQAALNISIDSIAFIDDDAFERFQVARALPEVLCIDAAEITGLAQRPELSPRFMTVDSRRRREMYRNEIIRNEVETSFTGPKDDFLATIGLKLRIHRAREEDLARAQELTRRTNQLNATGRIYDYDELAGALNSDRHDLLIAELEDRFGTYGKVGLALIERTPQAHTLRLLLMSCRVMSRGAGTIFLHQIMANAQKERVRLFADFVDTKKNRAMFVSYRFVGFREISRDGNIIVLENDLKHIPQMPPYVTVYLDYSKRG
jgi:FkbH-like protein